MDDLSDALRQMQAERAIRDLLLGYCRSLDEGRFEDTARLFEKGTWYLSAQTPITGSDDMLRFLKEHVVLYGGVPRTRHVITNIVITLSEDGSSAASTCYILGYLALPRSAPQIILQGAYHDRFKCANGEWHFFERRIEVDGTNNWTDHVRIGTEQGRLMD
jgi:SnoaL-like protein